MLSTELEAREGLHLFSLENLVQTESERFVLKFYRKPTSAVRIEKIILKMLNTKRPTAMIEPATKFAVAFFQFSGACSDSPL